MYKNLKGIFLKSNIHFLRSFSEKEDLIQEPKERRRIYFNDKNKFPFAFNKGKTGI